jgi:hypothetical protein
VSHRKRGHVEPVVALTVENTAEGSHELTDYRKTLVQLHQESQSSLDRTLIALSTGALGVSFAFVKQFLENRVPQKLWLLEGAWVFWILCTAAVLYSYAASARSARDALRSVDEGRAYSQDFDGKFGIVVERLNTAAGILFVAGLIAMVVFAALNLRGA